jgi:hypothetical protein
MSGNLKLNTALGGSIALTPENTASTITVTIPATNGTMLTTATAGVPIGGPAFSAYQSTGQSIATLTQTAVVLQTEEFDTNNNFASSIFAPTVAGYYQINGAVAFSGTSAGGAVCSIAKNGAVYKNGQFVNTNGTLGTLSTVSSLIYLNGTTDYVQLYVFVVTGSTTADGMQNTYFNGCLVRSAT